MSHEQSVTAKLGILGISYKDNPYKSLDADLAEDWLEGWQMASYKERQKSISKQIN